MTAWIETSNKVLLDSQWLKVSRKSFELENGVRIPEYYIIEKQDSAMAICYLEDEDCFILVRQYRPGVGKPTTCHPGGLIDASDDSPLKGALRELLEETGYRAYKTVDLGSFAPAPAFWMNHVHLYLVYCRSVSRIASAPEPTEDLEIVRVPRAELLSLVDSGEMDCIPCSLGSYRALAVLDGVLADQR